MHIRAAPTLPQRNTVHQPPVNCERAVPSKGTDHRRAPCPSIVAPGTATASATTPAPSQPPSVPHVVVPVCRSPAKSSRDERRLKRLQEREEWFSDITSQFMTTFAADQEDRSAHTPRAIPTQRSTKVAAWF